MSYEEILKFVIDGLTAVFFAWAVVSAGFFVFRKRNRANAFIAFLTCGIATVILWILGFTF